MELFASLISKYKIYLYIIVVALFLANLGYIQYLRYDNLSLTTQNITLSQTLENTNKKVENLQTSIKQITAINEDYIKTVDKLNNSQKALDEKLGKLEHAALGKPSLVKTRVNKASKERNRCFELVTGSPKIKNEKNSVCPDMVK